MSGSTWFAVTQAPHPDLRRPIANWEVGKPDWWLYPLERNGFKRTVVRGDLNSVFALPGGKQVWAVGRGGLIMHSSNGGATWAQQYITPAAPAPAPTPASPLDTSAKGASHFSLLDDAVAGELPQEQAPAQPPPRSLTNAPATATPSLPASEVKQAPVPAQAVAQPTQTEPPAKAVETPACCCKAPGNQRRRVCGSVSQACALRHDSGHGRAAWRAVRAARASKSRLRCVGLAYAYRWRCYS